MISVFEKEEAYWSAKFEGDEMMSSLPCSASSNRMTVPAADKAGLLRQVLPQELSARMLSLANGSDMAVYLIMLAGVGSLLHNYTSQEDVLVGMPAYHSGNGDALPIHDVLIIKNKVTAQSTLKSLLGQIKNTVREALEHQQIPFPKMVRPLNLQYDSAGQPVISTLAAYKKIHTSDYAAHVSWDTIWELDLENGRLVLQLSYCEQRYKREFIAGAVDHFIRILMKILFQPDAELGGVEMLSEDERQQLILDFNDTATERFPQNKTLAAVFEEQVLRTPDQAAVVYEGVTLTYRELNERANRVARVLRAGGVGADLPVAMLVERSPEMIVGMLAVLKAGGAYVPIDPQYPEERIRFVLEDCGAEHLLTQTRWSGTAAFNGQVICLDEAGLYEGPAGERENLEPASAANHLAYMIYTSGTTGKPKGVMIEQRSVVNFTMSLFEPIYEAHPEYQHMAQLAPYVFDMSVKPIYGALLLGRTLHIVPEETRLNGEKLLQFFREHRIDITDATPTFLSILVQAAADSDRGTGVRHYVIGGEALSVKVAQSVWDAFGEQVRITNVYGPTECTVDSTIYEVYPDVLRQSPMDSVPIGRPLPNQRLWILDRQQRLLPIGAAGEIHISGAGVARGYNGRPELTAEKFVQNPYAPEERMYKTGDLGRWLPDGTVEYLGRSDSQIKLRGYRIELGEVEARLLQLEPVREAAVLAREDQQGQQQLCAYFVADREMSVSELRTALSAEMPVYMIPAYFMQMDRMPLTTNGKLNRSALPAPDGDMETGTEYIAPRTEREEQLAVMWREILSVERVGVKDSFFALGGNSLHLMQLIHRVFTETGIELPIHRVFQNPTIESMAYELWESARDGERGQYFARLNAESGVSLFCLPPATGYAFNYAELARQLEGRCTVWAADFIGDEVAAEEIVERYALDVLRVQAQGPYILAGYSLGGNLMFEVAKLLEARGCLISDLIFVDSLIRLSANTFDSEEDLEQEVEDILGLVEELDGASAVNPLIRGRIRQKVKAYLSYGAQVVNSGEVQANIHALFTEETEAVRTQYSAVSWDGATRGRYTECRIAGEHASVLQGRYAEENARIVEDILNRAVRESGEAEVVLV